jgi:preprotein translocase subunit SecB
VARELKIIQIFLKDLFFQAPMGVSAFTQEWSPKVQVDVNVETEALGDDLHEVVLRLSVVSRTNDNTHFMIEIVQAGLFLVRGLDKEELERTLRTSCAETLYPYAREAIDGLVARARFPALLLSPIDFAASYDGL